MVKDYSSPSQYSDPAAYWTKVGHIYKSVCNEEAITYQRQIHLLGDYVGTLIRNEDNNIKRVLEIGSGYGRITKFMLEKFGDKLEAYHCIDISLPMIDCLLAHLEGIITSGKGAKFQIRHFDISQLETVHDFSNSLPYQDVYNYDLVIAIECLMHIRPESMKQTIKNITSFLRRGGHLINLDFYAKDGVGYALAPENFLHDYPSLYANCGPLKLSAIVRLDGQDQSLIHSIKPLPLP